jgi:hypothetical protein
VGPTYRGNITTNDCKRLRIVAKIALHEEQKEALRHEATVYSVLRNGKHFPAGGIPNMVGLYDDLDDEALVLVTTDVGDSLDRCGGNITER